MGINLLSKRRYQVAIKFKTADRLPVAGLMVISDYRRMIDDMRYGKHIGTYKIVLDGHDTELTFPVAEIDTVHAVPEVITDE